LEISERGVVDRQEFYYNAYSNNQPFYIYFVGEDRWVYYMGWNSGFEKETFVPVQHNRWADGMRWISREVFSQITGLDINSTRFDTLREIVAQREL
jgi:hypothetical protein